MAVRAGGPYQILAALHQFFYTLLSYLYISILQLISSQLFIPVLHFSQPSKYFSDFSVDELLAHLYSPLSYQILQCRIVPERIYSSVHLGNCPAILYSRQVRRLSTVEISIKTVLFFPCAHGIFLLGPWSESSFSSRTKSSRAIIQGLTTGSRIESM